MSAMVELFIECLKDIKVRVNSGLRRPAVNSIKRGNEGDPSTSNSFSPYNRTIICINVSIFLRIFKKLAVQHERSVRSLAG